MSEASRVSIPILRPELLTELWPADVTLRRTEPAPAEPPAARTESVLRRVRKRAKLIRRGSMPLLGGTLLAVFLVLGA